MKGPVIAVTLIAVGSATLPQRHGSGPAEPFTIYSSRIKMSKDGRWDPDPTWVKLRWEQAFEAPFLKIRNEVVTANLAEYDSDKQGVWAAKATSAYQDWYKDHQDPVKLYRVATYLAVARNIDRTFGQSKSYVNMDEHVILGFSVLRPENTPPSYEFCRRAYMVKAGDSHYHLFRDLAVRLLKRTPVDRGVALTMVREYEQRGADSAFESAMFGALEAASKAKDWRYWDEQWIARAWRFHAWHHNQKSSYTRAIAYLDKAIAKTPKGVDSTPIKTMRATFVRERELPHFGVPQFPKKKAGGSP